MAQMTCFFCERPPQPVKVIEYDDLCDAHKQMADEMREEALLNRDQEPDDTITLPELDRRFQLHVPDEDQQGA